MLLFFAKYAVVFCKVCTEKKIKYPLYTFSLENNV